jgi:hypothetical protein
VTNYVTNCIPCSYKANFRAKYREIKLKQHFNKIIACPNCPRNTMAIAIYVCNFILGYAGFLPIHPNSRLEAFRKTREMEARAGDTNVDATEVDSNTDLKEAEKT